MKKNLKYYSNLNYPIEIKKLTTEEGGGYIASIPMLGRNVFVADGTSPDEAIRNLESVKAEWFKTYIERGTTIPEPLSEDQVNFSGKFLLRVPKQLHRILSHRAKQNELSLNQYVQFLLTSSTVAEGFESIIKFHFERFSKVLDAFRSIEFKFKGEAISSEQQHEKLKIFNPPTETLYKKAI